MIESICNGGIDRQELHFSRWEDMNSCDHASDYCMARRRAAIALRFLFASVSGFLFLASIRLQPRLSSDHGDHLLDMGGYEPSVSRYIISLLFCGCNCVHAHFEPSLGLNYCTHASRKKGECVSEHQYADFQSGWYTTRESSLFLSIHAAPQLCSCTPELSHRQNHPIQANKIVGLYLSGILPIPLHIRQSLAPCQPMVAQSSFRAS